MGFDFPCASLPLRYFEVERILAISIPGKDKPGLVESVASVVSESGGNWLESHMCHLSGQFSPVSCKSAAENVDAIISGLKDFEQQGLRVLVHSEPGEPLFCAQAILSIP